MSLLSKKTVLFLCTGNYYRSRFAEHLFNGLAAEQGLPWQADSCGLAVGRSGKNIGPISETALRVLRQLAIAVPEPLRSPRQVADADLRQADHIVALKETEHRPLFQELHAAWTERVEFWHVHDVDFATPEEALPHIQQEVAGLIERIAAGRLRRRLIPLYAEPYYTFRFGEARLIPRFHLEGLRPGRPVRAYAADPTTLQPLHLLATACVGQGGWVTLAQPLQVRAGEVFVVFPQDETGSNGGTRG